MNEPYQRPRLNLPYAPVERLMEVLAAIGAVCMVGFAWANWPTLPARIATHFNAAGQADGWGGKGSLLLLPVLGVVLYGVMVFCARVPHLLNYPVPVTEENAPRLYLLARSLLTGLAFWVVAMLLFLEVSMIYIAQGKASGLGLWPMPLFLTAIATTLLVSVWRMMRAK